MTQTQLKPERKLDNWIEAYLYYTRHHIAEEQFHLWSALAVLSAAVNRSRWMDGGYYKTFPNLYVLFIGPSGIGKSTSSGIGMDMLRKAQIQTAIFTDSITAAGLIEFMSLNTVVQEVDGKMRNKTPILVYASEIGTMLNRRNSLEELTALLTELFNKDTDYENRTKGGGKTLIRNPNVTFWACCYNEWIDEMLNSISLRSGFLGRMLTIESRKKRFKENERLTDEDRALETDLIEDLKLISDQFGEMVWDAKAKVKWDKWTDTLPLDLTSEDTIEVQGFMSRKAQYVQRLAMLHSIARKDSKSLVTKADLKFGLSHIEICQGNTKKLKAVAPHVKNSDRVRDVILKVRNKEKDSIVPIRKIMPYVFRRMSLFDVDTSIDILCSVGFCERVGRKVKVLDEVAGAS